MNLIDWYENMAKYTFKTPLENLNNLIFDRIEDKMHCFVGDERTFLYVYYVYSKSPLQVKLVRHVGDGVFKTLKAVEVLKKRIEGEEIYFYKESNNHEDVVLDGKKTVDDFCYNCEKGYVVLMKNASMDGERKCEYLLRLDKFTSFKQLDSIRGKLTLCGMDFTKYKITELHSMGFKMEHELISSAFRTNVIARWLCKAPYAFVKFLLAFILGTVMVSAIVAFTLLLLSPIIALFYGIWKLLPIALPFTAYFPIRLFSTGVLLLIVLKIISRSATGGKLHDIGCKMGIFEDE